MLAVSLCAVTLLTLQPAYSSVASMRMRWATSLESALETASRERKLVVILADLTLQDRLGDAVVGLASAPQFEPARRSSIFVANWRAKGVDGFVRNLDPEFKTGLIWLDPKGRELTRETLGTGPLRVTLGHQRALGTWRLQELAASGDERAAKLLEIRSGEVRAGLELLRNPPEELDAPTLQREVAERALSMGMVHAAHTWYREAALSAKTEEQEAQALFGLLQTYWIQRVASKTSATLDSLKGKESYLTETERTFLERVRNSPNGRAFGRP